ncbi:glycosyltransferase [Kineococcus radiotolerans]|uniref:Glycosyl transferase family 28 C-terminal domain-containing protein n=1 Tax=Kineococcus radiotolerans (strain ATCC BAA-149 / DSM 14245 / SRS30216) TaxID=266940 RepID=A6WGG2_KINRD|nr:glycosyltransferase [Kineococcus radiotolerans]ABS05901.1 conserved hypothetical protein [Kineococcus radiotolerans SRS30216 = ATCC BAA-149]
MIGWYVHHQGAGHRQRLTAVAAHLRTPVTALSSAPRPADWTGGWVELAPDDTPPVDRASAEAGGRLHWVPLHHAGLRARSAAIAGWIEAARPRLLVADVSVEVTLLARLCGVPVVVAAMLGDRHDAPHRLGRDVAQALLAPWPAPAGSAPSKVVHVGAFSRFDGRPTRPDRVRPGSVLVLWGSGGRDVGEEAFRAARDATPGWTWEYLVPGSPLSTGGDVWDALQRAEVVVVHGGHNAVAEVAAARRPAVVVAQERPFDEQRRRADLLRAEGLVALDAWPAAADWPGLLERARAVGAGPWARWAPGDGAQRAARFLDDLAREQR